jgi:hypothetical protein
MFDDLVTIANGLSERHQASALVALVGNRS